MIKVKYFTLVSHTGNALKILRIQSLILQYQYVVFNRYSLRIFQAAVAILEQ